MLKKIIQSPFFIYPLLTCIFFWPISLQIFTFKNDALTYYYPVRTLISDALNNFELPLWTPYINMGYPLHADMQSGAWNPVIWIISFLTNYSLAAFHYEILFYLALGGTGFYYLAREQGWSKNTALITGVAYEFSGPVIDSMQFTAFISSICYIPFVFLFFRRLLYNKPTLANALLSALFLYLLFTGGYPALFIITCYLLFTFLLFAFFSSTQKTVFLKRSILPLGIFAVVFTLVSLPAFISFINHLQFIERGKKQGLEFLLENSMPPSCMLSLISPFSTTATSPFFNTNLLMRNVYIGLVPLAFLIYAGCNKSLRNNKQVRFYFITSLVLFGIAWGSHLFLRQLAYYTLPMMNSFRHPAIFRLFGVIFLLLAAGVSINEWDKKSNNNETLRKIILSITSLILLISVILILFSSGTLMPPKFTLTRVENLIPSLGFTQRFLIQLPFMLTTLGLFYLVAAKNKGLIYMLLLSILDLFFAAQLNIPITAIGKRNFSAAELHINRNPVRFPLPGNTSIELNTAQSIDSTNTIGSTLPFEKKIGRNDYYVTPGNLLLQDQFFESSIRKPVFKNRVVYIADTILVAGNHDETKKLTTPSFAIISKPSTSFARAASKSDSINIKKLSANTVECSVETSSPGLLILLQNIYPGWKVFIDGNETSIYIANITFMGVNIPAGKHTVVFRYQPLLIIYAWYISLLTLLAIALFSVRFILRGRLLLG